MPRQYSLGGRVAPERGRPRGSKEPPPKDSLRERLGALRNIGPFIASVWHTSPALCIASIVLRLVRALLPVVTLYVGKLIIDEVTHLLRSGIHHADWHEWLSEWRLDAIVVAARSGIRIGGDRGHSRPHRVADRFVAVRALFERDQRHAHAARRVARSRRFRRCRFAGQTRPRAASGRRPQRSVVAAARPSAGHGDDHQFRRRTFRLRAVVDSAGVRRRGARIHRRVAFQCAKLCRELSVDAGTARTGLPAHGRGQRDDGKGSEEFRTQSVSYRPIQSAVAIDLSRESSRRVAARGLGRIVHDDRHHRLLRGVCVHRVAHGHRRIHDRRSDISVHIVQTSAQPA